ncbi:MAG: DNA methyltransferase, partial [Mycobacterium sp.]
MAASGIVDALTWIEEPRTRDAFFTVIGRQYLIGGAADERLPVLFAESVAAAEEITEALGAQVRRAVELLIASFSESADDAQRRGLPNPLPDDPHDAYEAAVTIMMRIVFLLFAEERDLLPAGELFEQGYGISGSLDRLQGRETAESEEALDATSMMWHRLLATSQALYAGAAFEGMRMPAYGGSLFDPARFPFLTATTEQGTLAVTVSDRVMLHALRSVQQAELKGGEARRISFRDIDVEQIGYIYEGLLGYTAITVNQIFLGLAGKKGEEPEIPLAKLEELGAAHHSPKQLAEAIRAWVEHDQPAAKPQSVAAVAKSIGAQAEPNTISALTQAVGDDTGLRDRILPWLGLMRLDLRGRPFVVRPGGLMVEETPSRKNAGAHYTPKSLAEEVVLHALQPLCYAPGPYQTAEETQWKLKSSDDLLSLKVADIACGSGAFLVAATEYLARRVVEAWTAEDPANSQRGDLLLRAKRKVVANCIYGADINDMAVEMCKLSLWLVSLDRDLPFSFVDDKIFLGNSLLGLTSLDQLRKLHIDPSRVPPGEMFDIFDVDIDAIIRKAADLRRKLASEIDENDPARNSAAKR